VGVDVPRALAGEVERRVLGEVDDRRGVARRGVVDADRALPDEGVDDLDLQRAGIALLAVRADPAQDEAVLARLGDVPDPAVEALLPAVEGVRPVVAGQDVLAPARVKRPPAMRLA
jgi:hypothetical protein